MGNDKIKIRRENKEDNESIHLLNVEAFGQAEEANIVDKLRNNCDTFLSFIAEIDGNIVGHILFTVVTIESDQGVINGMGLAPMAVLPESQKQGIGSNLVLHGLEKLRQIGCSFVVVLGHSEYYPKFGFEPAIRYGIRCEWDVPDEVFMIKVFDELKMNGLSGVAKYRHEFSEGM